MSRHIQFESNMTLSGANADLRVPLKINEQKLVLIEIYKSIFGSNRLKLESNCLDRLEIASDSILNVLIADAL